MKILYLQWRQMLSNEKNSWHYGKIQISLLKVINKDSSKACYFHPNLHNTTSVLTTVYKHKQQSCERLLIDF